MFAVIFAKHNRVFFILL